MRARFASFTFALALASLASGCSQGPAGADDLDDDANDSAALTAANRAVLGRYESNSATPTFRQIYLHVDKTFAATLINDDYLEGTFKVTPTTLTLVEGERGPNKQYGTYDITHQGPDAIRLFRRGAGWSGWSDSIARLKGLWSSDITSLSVETTSFGGEVAPAPEGSDCSVLDEKYRYEVASKTVAWDACNTKSSSLWKRETGQHVLSETEVGDVEALMAATAVYPRLDRCELDEAFDYALTIVRRGETKSYRSAFWACEGVDGVFVDGLEDAMTLFGRFRRK